jgi:hypothetical protein
MKQIALIVLISLTLMSTAQADYKLGVKHHVDNGVAEFETIELFMDGKFSGFIYENSNPIKFSSNFYVYATCPVDKSTQEPDGYCINWQIYDVNKKVSRPLTLPGLTVFSDPSFSWPYISYVKVPDNLANAVFKDNLVEVSCVVIEWPKKNIVAQSRVKVSIGNVETDAPGSFVAPVFSHSGNSIKVTCSEFEGPEIATVFIPNGAKQ